MPRAPVIAAVHLVSPLLLAATLAILFALPSVLVAREFEQPPVLRASDILPPEALRSEHHEVFDEVHSDGDMNHFRIASDFGRFEAPGEAMLATRVQEIGALAELAKVSKAKVFADSSLKAITRPVTAVTEFAERPGETVAGIGKGVGRMWKRAKRTAGEVKDDVKEKKQEKKKKDEETGEGQAAGDKTAGDKTARDKSAEAAKSYAKKYFGSTAAERRWAEKLGVDPYTTNETLRKGIREVARVDAAGGFAVRLVGMPSIPGVNVIASVNHLVWSKDPGELKELNTGELAAMGADKALIDRFFANPFFLSPTRQTRFVTALADLDGVADRVVAVELAAGAESEPEALHHVGAAIMLGWLHGGGETLARLAPFRVIPMALTADGRLAVAVPTDHTYWSENLAAAVEHLDEIGRSLGADRREAWFRGEVSERCRRELEERGWKVSTRAAVGLGS